MIEKPKNSAARMRLLPFLALWTIPGIAAWLMVLGLLRTNWAVFGPDAPHALLVGLIPGMIPALGHMLLMRYGLNKKSVTAWLPISLIGSLASAAAYYAYLQTSTNPFSELSTASRVAALFVPMALIQAGWLSRRVNSAWLWVVGGIVGAVAFALPLQTANLATDDATAALFLSLGAIVQAAITGSVMRHLWTQEREKEKRASADESELAHAERLDRLHETLHPGEQLTPEIRRAQAATRRLTGS